MVNYISKKEQANLHQYKRPVSNITYSMMHRINAIDNELLSCMNQLRNIMPEYVDDEYLGVYLDADDSRRSLPAGHVRPSGFRRKPYTQPIPTIPAKTVTKSPPSQTVEGPITQSFKGGESGYLIHINELDVPLTFKYSQTPENQRKIADALNDAKKFKDWCRSIHTGAAFEAGGVIVHDTVMFGKNLGFVTVTANIKHKTEGTQIPGFVFIRGHAVGILITLHCDDGKTYTLLTKQARVATGKMDFMEIPAGMLDNSNDFTGIAITELKQETGIHVQQNELIELTDTSSITGMYLSPGGCDEAMRLFLFSAKISTADITKLNGRLTGERHEGERIELVIKELDTLAGIPDMKTVCAYNMYKNLKLIGTDRYTCKGKDQYVEIKD